MHVSRCLLTALSVDFAAAWEALLAFDSLIFILTVLKTYKGRHRHYFIPVKRINIVSLVLRDGVSIDESLRFCETDLSNFNWQVLSIICEHLADHWGVILMLIKLAKASWPYQT